MRALAAFLLSLVLLGAHAGEPADACVADLDVLPAFLLANDAGARANLAERGAAAVDAAFARARAQARTIERDEDCLDALRGYLRAYRHGHLTIASRSSANRPSDTQNARSDPRAPQFRVLSPRTTLLVLPSFGDLYAARIEALLAVHRAEIESRPFLIVDVRRNNGGSDASYAPLLPLVAANTTRTPGAEFLATADNIAASEAVCKLPSVVEATCTEFMRPVVEAMRGAPSGTFVLPASEQRLQVETPERVLERPSRVAVMIDRACGSSCEEFVLVVRQSFKVKTFGRPTYGSLDYSNLRPHDLPSGKRRLFYATSRSLRLPAFPIDAAGIAPDQFLPPPADDAAFDAEIETVRAVLEN
jgi:hypothetical protein